MFRQSKPKKQENIQAISNTFTGGATVDQFSPLKEFNFVEKPLPKDRNYPFTRLDEYLADVSNESYIRSIFLPSHVFMVELTFRSEDGSKNKLPKITNGSVIKNEKVDREIKTPLCFGFNMTEHEAMQKETYEAIFEVADLPLVDFLKKYGAELDNVKEFLAIHESASKTCSREVPFVEEHKNNNRLTR